MAEKRQWPSLDEYLADENRGRFDDRTAAIPPYDLEPDEILSPEEEAELERLLAEEARQQRP